MQAASQDGPQSIAAVIGLRSPPVKLIDHESARGMVTAFQSRADRSPVLRCVRSNLGSVGRGTPRLPWFLGSLARSAHAMWSFEILTSWRPFLVTSLSQRAGRQPRSSRGFALKDVPDGSRRVWTLGPSVSLVKDSDPWVELSVHNHGGRERPKVSRSWVPIRDPPGVAALECPSRSRLRPGGSFMKVAGRWLPQARRLRGQGRGPRSRRSLRDPRARCASSSAICFPFASESG
jgi:hypothetical protein